MKHKIPKHIQKLLSDKKGDVIKIDVGCGEKKTPGFIGIDVRDLPGVDIVHDIETYPWPVPDETATLIMCGHVVEHINPNNWGFIKFMNELWRVLKVDGQVMISTPYAGSAGYWADPTHVNGCTAQTWMYFDPLAAMNFYAMYKPLPWKIEQTYFQPDGNMEVLLSKRRWDHSYGCKKP